MDTSHLADFRHLIDLSKTCVSIDFSECMDCSPQLDNMSVFFSLLGWVRDNFEQLKFYNINKESFTAVIEKIEYQNRITGELTEYVKASNAHLRKEKPWYKDNPVSIGVSRRPFNVTLLELISLYKGLEILEEEYENIKDDPVIMWDSSMFYKNIYSIKHMLENRLTYAVVNM